MKEMPANQLDPRVKNVWRINDAIWIILIFACLAVAPAIMMTSRATASVGRTLLLAVGICFVVVLIVWLVVLPPIRFARCCSPVPGDDIVGYITRGRGVTIHKAECANALNGESERRVPVEWAVDGDASFYASIKVIAYDRVNMLGEIASVIGEMNVSIKAAQVQTDEKTRISTLKLTLDVHSREQMDRVIAAVRNKVDVMDVYRVTA